MTITLMATLVWQTTYEGSTYAIISMPNDDTILVGDENYRRFDNEGAEVWSFELSEVEDSRTERATDIRENPDGGYRILARAFMPDDTYVYYFIDIDEDGTISNKQTLEFALPEREQPSFYFMEAGHIMLLVNEEVIHLSPDLEPLYRADLNVMDVIQLEDRSLLIARMINDNPFLYHYHFRNFSLPEFTEGACEESNHEPDSTCLYGVDNECNEELDKWCYEYSYDSAGNIARREYMSRCEPMGNLYADCYTTICDSEGRVRRVMQDSDCDDQFEYGYEYFDFSVGDAAGRSVSIGAQPTSSYMTCHLYERDENGLMVAKYEDHDCNGQPDDDNGRLYRYNANGDRIAELLDDDLDGEPDSEHYCKAYQYDAGGREIYYSSSSDCSDDITYCRETDYYSDGRHKFRRHGCEDDPEPVCFEYLYDESDNFVGVSVDSYCDGGESACHYVSGSCLPDDLPVYTADTYGEENGDFPAGYCDYNICFPVPPTGQDKCYETDNVFNELTCPGGIPAVCGEISPIPACGQDAQYAGNTRTFSCFNGDGNEVACSSLPTAAEDEVVTDSLTGLMWQRISGSEISWEEANEACENLECGGYEDWRLPTRHELQSIVDYGKSFPALDAVVFPETPSNSFWTRFESVSNSDFHLAIEFEDGTTSGGDGESTYPFRCVRSGPFASGDGSYDPFIVSGSEGEETVSDSTTGLIWQKQYETYLNWGEALTYCEGLSYAGYSDWRLPNVSELFSMVEVHKTDPASSFPDIPSEYFYSSTSYSGGTPDNSYNRAYVVNFDYGIIVLGDPGIKSIHNHVRCVRGGN